jgi:hypothetical protein
MEYPDICGHAEWRRVATETQDSDLPEIDKLARAFDWVTKHIVERGEKEIEVARALGDKDSVIKNKIKTETIRHARAVFQTCHQLVTGRRPWDE